MRFEFLRTRTLVPHDIMRELRMNLFVTPSVHSMRLARDFPDSAVTGNRHPAPTGNVASRPDSNVLIGVFVGE